LLPAPGRAPTAWPGATCVCPGPQGQKSRKAFPPCRKASSSVSAGATGENLAAAGAFQRPRLPIAAGPTTITYIRTKAGWRTLPSGIDLVQSPVDRIGNSTAGSYRFGDRGAQTKPSVHRQVEPEKLADSHNGPGQPIPGLLTTAISWENTRS